MERSKNKLIHWLFWFSLGNAVLYWLIGIRYLNTLTFTHIAATIPSNLSMSDPLGIFLVAGFIFTAYFAYLAVLACIPNLIILPITLLFPKRNLTLTLSVIMATFAAVLLIIDCTVFAQYRFHLNGIILKMVSSGSAKQIFDFSWLEWLLISIFSLLLLITETWYANFLWHKIAADYFLNRSAKALLILITTLLISIQFFITGLLIYPTRQVPETARILPLYNLLMTTLLPSEYGTNYLNILSLSSFAQPQQGNAKLQYPLQTLRCFPTSQPKNILMIAIDAWRFDMLTPQVTPHLYQFAKSAWQFTNHWSGGNSTQPGIFSLFYGLPNTYWTSMLMQRQGPVLISSLINQGYQMGIFSSASLQLPAFNKTIFNDLPNIRTLTAGANAVTRDNAITKNFIQFLSQATQDATKPFFGFLFYDTAHSFCNEGVPNKPFQPATGVCNRFFDLGNDVDATPYLNRYKNALFMIDGLINQVLTYLQQRQLLDNTIVIITGDHGNEFNDNKLNYWGHASNFTQFQAQTPLVIYWPNQHQQRITQLTSHYDIAPTLLKAELSCQNSASDYSLGRDLKTVLVNDQASITPKFLIISSYIDFGIVEADRITTILPTGEIELTDTTNHPIPQASIRMDVVKAAFHEIKKFYEKP